MQASADKHAYKKEKQPNRRTTEHPKGDNEGKKVKEKWKKPTDENWRNTRNNKPKTPFSRTIAEVSCLNLLNKTKSVTEKFFNQHKTFPYFYCSVVSTVATLLLYARDSSLTSCASNNIGFGWCLCTMCACAKEILPGRTQRATTQMNLPLWCL